ncbi:MAG TPA: hypothetical protein VFA29_09545, partial [Candidatus Baltobacteraceae bacterium]|nr:hypothetical protein [Candidatus Baltobacteraceae bacterium]
MMTLSNIMTQLRIRLFGEPEFSIGGKEHAFDAPPRALPLLAYLLMHRETRLNRETVSNLIWPDVTEEEARANLRRHLHYIKRALPALPGGESWMDVSKTIVRWNPTVPVWLDVAEFENLSKSP